MDLSVHLRLLSPSDAIEGLHAAVPIPAADAREELLRICLTPLEAAATVLVREDLLALREAWRAAPRKGSHPPHPLAALHATVLAYAAMPPTLARWGMGIDG